MQRKLALGLATLFYVAALTVAALAQQPTLGETKAAWWGKQAVEFFQANGKDKALAEFNNPQGKFVRDNLYIFVLDLNGKMLAHPHGDYVGQDFMTVKDADGKLFAADIVKAAQEKGSGWADFKWENPQTKKVEPTSVYFQKVDGVIISRAKLRKVRTSTNRPNTPRSCKVGPTATVPTISEATRNSSPSRMALPKSLRKLRNPSSENPALPSPRRNTLMVIRAPSTIIATPTTSIPTAMSFRAWFRTARFVMAATPISGVILPGASQSQPPRPHPVRVGVTRWG
jgi:cytochrome c